MKCFPAFFRRITVKPACSNSGTGNFYVQNYSMTFLVSVPCNIYKLLTEINFHLRDHILTISAKPA